MIKGNVTFAFVITYRWNIDHQKTCVLYHAMMIILYNALTVEKNAIGRKLYFYMIIREKDLLQIDDNIFATIMQK